MRVTRKLTAFAIGALLAVVGISEASQVKPQDQNLAAGSSATAKVAKVLVPSATPASTVRPASTPAGGGTLKSAAGFSFPSASSSVIGSVGFIDADQVGYFWSAASGHSVAETFSGPAAITSYTLDVDVITNVLNSGAFVNWDVIINGVTVDNFTVVQGFLGTVSRSAGFAAIAGPTYAVSLKVTNVVAGGQGSHTFRYAGAGLHALGLNDCPPLASAEVVRLGTPPNPAAYMPGTTGPVIGGVWDPLVLAGFSGGLGVISFMDISFMAPINVSTPFGTLLCVIPPSGLIFVVPSGSPFQIPVPNDCALVGASFCSQGGELDGSLGIHLANALDCVIGTF
jgi:hypothetical protein